MYKRQGSDYVDAYFESHYQGALAAGLKIGYYHYVTAQNEEEAREQARFFCSLIRGKTVDLYPACLLYTSAPTSARYLRPGSE